MDKPTLEQFTKLQAAYDYFNTHLFDGQLRPCLLVFRDGRKSKHSITLGHFAWGRWENGEGSKCHEISLNPEALKRPLIDTMATLVHEMCHQWQYDHGHDFPKNGAYHNMEWVRKMKEVGLAASDTGKPGGKRTGVRMSHYVMDNGPFGRVFESMPVGLRLPWITGAVLGKPGTPRQPRPATVKYTCPECDTTVRGESGLRLVCGVCNNPYEEE